jgi:hypothetical protein
MDSSSDTAVLSTQHWSAADVDNDGTLSLAELQVAAPSLAPKFQDMDTNRDGKLTRDELRAYHTSHPASSAMDADQGASHSSSTSNTTTTTTTTTPSTSTSSSSSSTPPSTDDTTTGTDNKSGTTGQ